MGDSCWSAGDTNLRWHHVSFPYELCHLRLQTSSYCVPVKQTVKEAGHISHSRALKETRLCIWQSAEHLTHLRKWDFLPPREHSVHMLLYSLGKAEGTAWGSLKERHPKTGCGSDGLAQTTVIHYEGQEKKIAVTNGLAFFLSSQFIFAFVSTRGSKQRSSCVRRDLS